MSDNRDLCFIPAADLVRLYRSRKISPLEVMQAVLARVDAVNPTVNAYVTVARESALTAARRATQALGRKGAPLPPLHGVPVSIKDLTSTKGIRTTCAAVAVATGMGPIAQGTDLGGSLRTPAAFCGVLGFHHAGARPPTPQGDGVGHARGHRAAGAHRRRRRLMLSAMAGPDDRAPLSYEVDTSQFARAVKARCPAASRGAGCPSGSRSSGVAARRRRPGRRACRRWLLHARRELTYPRSAPGPEPGRQDGPALRAPPRRHGLRVNEAGEQRYRIPVTCKSSSVPNAPTALNRSGIP
jgi:hypothetical protein